VEEVNSQRKGNLKTTNKLGTNRERERRRKKCTSLKEGKEAGHTEEGTRKQGKEAGHKEEGTRERGKEAGHKEEGTREGGGYEGEEHTGAMSHTRPPQGLQRAAGFALRPFSSSSEAHDEEHRLQRTASARGFKAEMIEVLDSTDMT